MTNNQILKILIFCFFSLSSAFLLSKADFTHAATPPLIINEVAWMGTLSSCNDEWLELYNNTGESINLEGWKLKAGDGTPEIQLRGNISGKGFYLLERTDDNTVPNIKADLIYKGSLNNEGEKLELYDKSGNLIDLVDCSAGWFAGDNTTKQTMERKNEISTLNATGWQTSQIPEGTPKAENSIGVQPKKNLIESSKYKTGGEEENNRNNLASMQSYSGTPPRDYSILLIGVGAAIFFGIVTLIFKKHSN